MPDPLDDLQALAEDLKRRQRYRTVWRAVLVTAHVLSGAACLVLVVGDVHEVEVVGHALWALVVVHTATLAHLVMERTERPRP